MEMTAVAVKGKKSKSILVSLGTGLKATRSVLTGILRCSLRHPDLEIRMRGSYLDRGWLASIDADAVVGAIVGGPDDPHTKSVLAMPNLRAVVFTYGDIPKGLKAKAVTITPDERAIGVTAANLFVKHGLRHFAYVPAMEDFSWNRERERSFCNTLAQGGHAVDVYRHGKKKTFDRKRMAIWLKSLSAPCGVFVAYDQLARSVLDVCRAEKIDVPKRLQVLGVDDEDFICELSRPTLSSIAPDFEEGGVRALDVLDGLLEGREPSGQDLKMPVQAVVERLSTSDFTNSANRVAVAREYIRQHATDGIGVQNVVSCVTGSCRMLEKDFRSVLGHTIRDEIIEARLSAVRRLLRNSSVPIEQIAARCGFSKGNYLKNAFFKRYGMTMRAYRKGK